MTVINKSALVPFRAEEMYALVNDVEAYPEFLPWCESVQVLFRTHDSLQATLGIAQGKLKQSFTTRNSMEEGRRITMRLVEGPFKHLNGTWVFTPLGSNGCDISLHMEFEFSNSLVRLAFGQVFSQVANSLVDAFCKRAPEKYGRR
jgi:ribosome-associated toxin RatA of RatAB toxin-antitoxin module